MVSSGSSFKVRGSRSRSPSVPESHPRFCCEDVLRELPLLQDICQYWPQHSFLATILPQLSTGTLKTDDDGSTRSNVTVWLQLGFWAARNSWATGWPPSNTGVRFLTVITYCDCQWHTGIFHPWWLFAFCNAICIFKSTTAIVEFRPEFTFFNYTHYKLVT